MFYMAVYFFFAYLVVVPLVKGIASLLHNAGTRPFLRNSVCAALALLPLMPYCVVDVQTLLFRPVLEPAVRASDQYWGDPKERFIRFRVLFITPLEAKVNIVTSCGTSYTPNPTDMTTGDVYYLRRTASGWKVTTGAGGTAWSDCGSADGNIFPPYPEAKEF